MSTTASRVHGSAAGASGSRMMDRLEQLAACTEEEGRITRPYLSPAHRKAADLVGDWMTAAAMAPRMDAVGTLFARFEGATHDAPTLMLGSHIDSVPHGGKFDGTLGVVCALEVVALLHASGKRLPFAIEVIAFGDEEGRFPSTLGGSRLVAGTFDPAILDEKDAGGISRRDALVAFGCDPGHIALQSGRRDRVLGYVEVHIEQGPVLESLDKAVGVVTAINGATRGTVEVRGCRGHAGTVPMQLRADAYCAAAEMALAIERRALEEADLVATVGRIDVPGGVVNTIPGLAQFTIDARSPSDERRLAAVADISRSLEAIAARRKVEARITLGYQAPATPCDPTLSDYLAKAIQSQGIEPFRLPSGAGHDAMSFRGCWPVAMLFVRCRDGVSHSPDEFATVADIETAARTLHSFVEAFAAKV